MLSPSFATTLVWRLQWTECLCAPNSSVEIDPTGDGLGDGPLGDRGLMMGPAPSLKGPQNTPSPLPSHEDTEEMQSVNQTARCSPDTNSASALSSDFQPPDLEKETAPSLISWDNSLATKTPLPSSRHRDPTCVRTEAAQAVAVETGWGYRAGGAGGRTGPQRPELSGALQSGCVWDPNRSLAAQPRKLKLGR